MVSRKKRKSVPSRASLQPLVRAEDADYADDVENEAAFPGVGGDEDLVTPEENGANDDDDDDASEDENRRLSLAAKLFANEDENGNEAEVKTPESEAASDEEESRELEEGATSYDADMNDERMSPNEMDMTPREEKMAMDGEGTNPREDETAPVLEYDAEFETEATPEDSRIDSVVDAASFHSSVTPIDSPIENHVEIPAPRRKEEASRMGGVGCGGAVSAFGNIWEKLEEEEKEAFMKWLDVQVASWKINGTLLQASVSNRFFERATFFDPLAAVSVPAAASSKAKRKASESDDRIEATKKHRGEGWTSSGQRTTAAAAAASDVAENGGKSPIEFFEKFITREMISRIRDAVNDSVNNDVKPDAIEFDADANDIPNRTLVTKGEIMAFFGVLVLLAKESTGNLAALWRTPSDDATTTPTTPSLSLRRTREILRRLDLGKEKANWTSTTSVLAWIDDLRDRCCQFQSDKKIHDHLVSLTNLRLGGDGDPESNTRRLQSNASFSTSAWEFCASDGFVKNFVVDSEFRVAKSEDEVFELLTKLLEPFGDKPKTLVVPSSLARVGVARRFRRHSRVPISIVGRTRLRGATGLSTQLLRRLFDRDAGPDDVAVVCDDGVSVILSEEDEEEEVCLVSGLAEDDDDDSEDLLEDGARKALDLFRRYSEALFQKVSWNLGDLGGENLAVFCYGIRIALQNSFTLWGSLQDVDQTDSRFQLSQFGATVADALFRQNDAGVARGALHGSIGALSDRKEKLEDRIGTRVERKSAPDSRKEALIAKIGVGRAEDAKTGESRTKIEPREIDERLDSSFRSHKLKLMPLKAQPCTWCQFSNQVRGLSPPREAFIQTSTGCVDCDVYLHDKPCFVAFHVHAEKLAAAAAAAKEGVERGVKEPLPTSKHSSRSVSLLSSRSPHVRSNPAPQRPHHRPAISPAVAAAAAAATRKSPAAAVAPPTQQRYVSLLRPLRSVPTSTPPTQQPARPVSPPLRTPFNTSFLKTTLVPPLSPKADSPPPQPVFPGPPPLSLHKAAGGGAGAVGAARGRRDSGDETRATPPPLQPGIPSSIANMMAAFNISPKELITVRDRLMKRSAGMSDASQDDAAGSMSPEMDEADRSRFNGLAKETPLFLRHLNVSHNNDDNDADDDEADLSKRSLDHFRAKLQKLRPASLGSIAPRPSTSVVGESSGAVASRKSAVTSAATAAAAWAAAAGHPNPSIHSVSTQLADMLEVDEPDAADPHSIHNYQQMTQVVNAQFPNHCVSKFPGRQKTCKWCTRLRSTTRSGRRPETTYGCAICGLNLHRDYCFLAYHYHLVVPLADKKQLPPP